MPENSLSYRIVFDHALDMLHMDAFRMADQHALHIKIFTQPSVLLFTG
jgi:hypothetical protein